MKQINNTIVVCGQINSGKTTTCNAIANRLRSEGYSVANLKFTKGMDDYIRYSVNGNKLYLLPLEVIKSRTDLERFIPEGYDWYIIEGSYPNRPDWPVAVMHMALFHDDEVNVTVPVSEQNQDAGYQPIVTMVERPIKDQPYVTVREEFGGFEHMRLTALSPKLTLPIFKKTAAAIGYFPNNLFDMFPYLRYYEFDYHSFFRDITHHTFDAVIIGKVHPEYFSRFREHSWQDTLCFHPPVFIDNLEKYPIDGISKKEGAKKVIEFFTKKPVGSAVPKSLHNTFYERYNNEFWERMDYKNLGIISEYNDVIILNGPVHPRYYLH